jgi:hypothetical protein
MPRRLPESAWRLEGDVVDIFREIPTQVYIDELMRLATASRKESTKEIWGKLVTR